MGHVIRETNALGHVIRRAYDINGNQISEHGPGPDQLTKFCYDYMNHRISEEIVLPSGECLKTTHQYDVMSNKIASCDPYGNKTHYEYDPFEITTTYTYDAADRLTQKERAGARICYFYDTLSREVEVHEHFGLGASEYLVKAKKYDLLNQIIEETELDASGVLQNWIGYSYDEAGNRTVVKTRNQAGESCHTTRYNVLNEPIALVDALQNTYTIARQYSYRHRHEMKVPYSETTDPLNRKTLHIHDAHHRLSQVQKLSASGNLIQMREQSYDLNGNLIKTVESVIGRNAAPVITTYSYDVMNRLTSTMEAAGTAEQKLTQHVYAPFGQVVKLLKRDGNSLHYEYDPLERLTSLTSSNQDLSYRLSYDDNDLPILIEDLKNNFQNHRKYNTAGYLVYEQLGNGLEMHMEQDFLGRITSITYPDQSYVKYLYQGKYLVEVQRFSSVGKILYSQIYLDYDLSGNPLQIKRAGACGEAQYQYDLLNRPTQIQTPFWKEQITNYDARGLLRHRILTDNLGTDACHYAYDEYDQLTSETGTAQHSFVNDSLYNQITKNDIPQKFNALHQLLQEAEMVYDHDRNGNRISKKQGDQTIAYEYDSLDRLTRIQTDKESVQYIYDYDNRRLYKKFFLWDNAQATWVEQEFHRYLYVGNNEVGTVDSTGKIIELRILGLTQGAEVGAAIAHEKEGQLYVPEHDHQGHVVLLLDLATGPPQETYRYSAFGSEQLYDANGNQLQTPRSPWRFASKRLDPESGFVYFGERYYDSASCRWITPDPLGSADGPNSYAYVKNNPLTNIDPDGRFAIEAYQKLEAFKHWKDHKNEFPELRNSKQYVEKAWAFFKSPPNGTLSKIRPNGEILYYHEASNTFVSYTKEGIPKTMFCPKNRMEYWKGQ